MQSQSTQAFPRAAASRGLAALAVAAMLALALVPAVASAADPKKNKGRTLSFEEDVVETSYLRPEGTVIEGINKKKRQSLIRIRLDFYQEIMRSAQDI